MAELQKRIEEEEKKANEWLNQYRPNFESTISRIGKFQERKLFNLEIIALVLFGAFLVNALSTSIFDLALTLTSPPNNERLLMDSVFSVASVSGIIIIFIYFRSQLKKYQPKRPVLTVIVKPNDIQPFINQDRFKDILQFIENGKLTDFRQFSEATFKHIEDMSMFLFGQEVKPHIQQYEEKATIANDEEHKGLVTIARDYDLSKLSRTGVKITLQVKLTPDVVYQIGQEGDKTASYSFFVSFHFIVLNPEHFDSDKLIEEYYSYRAKEIVKFTSYSINWAFRDVGLKFAMENRKIT